jgi:hypothetical protein
MDRYSTSFGVLAGAAVGAVGCFTAVLLAGGGHGSYLPAKFLFPFTMGSIYWLGSITKPFVFLAIVQFPFYGWFLSRTIFDPKKKIMAWCLLACHVIVVIALLVVPLSYFP